MITIDYIKKNALPHDISGGKRMILYNEKYVLSIVGGTKGLYGDFENDFEVAIIDPLNKEFITKLFFPENGDDVVGYLSCEELEKIANTLFKEDNFQVR
jgi:hypothetical protein